MPRNILVLLSEYGYWGEELLGPLETFDQNGYNVVFATPTGKRSRALPPSLDASYLDPPLQRTVTSEDVAARCRALDQSDRLDNALSLAEMVPDRPYFAVTNFAREIEKYYADRDEAIDRIVSEYDTVLIVGGSGAIVDLGNNGRVHELVLGFHRAGKPVAAICYGVVSLVMARDWDDRKSLIWGKHLTGHCKEYDYKDGTGFIGTDFNMGPPPYSLEYMIRDAVGPDGQYHGRVGHETSVIVDYPFITGRSNHDSFLTGQKIVEVLENGLTRYGW